MALGIISVTSSVAVLVIFVTTGIVWTRSGRLETAAEDLTAYYGLPAVVQGSIIIAVESSCPELASVVITAVSGSFSMGLQRSCGPLVTYWQNERRAPK